MKDNAGRKSVKFADSKNNKKVNSVEPTDEPDLKLSADSQLETESTRGD